MDVDYLPAFSPEGTLEQMPLPVLVMHLLDRRASGMLYLEHQEASYWLYFEEGFPAGVHNPQSQDYLGQVLRELGYVDDAAFNQSLMEMAKSKRLQGEILLELGAIDDEQLERALALQLARKMSRLFALRAGGYRFVEDEDIPPPHEPMRINPYALVYNGIKNAYNAEDLKRGLEVLVGRSCKVTGLFIQRKELFEFPADDLADAELLREFRLPQQFVRATRGGTTAGMMLLLTLLYCGMLELEEADFAQPLSGAKAASGPAAQPRPAPAAQPAAKAAASRPAAGASRPAAQKSKVPAELLRKLNDKFEQVKKAPLWEVLEVEKDANSETIKRSFLTLAKVYHPDRVSNSGDEEAMHRMQVVFARINEAYQVLSDPNQRAAYEQQAEQRTAADGKERPEEARVQYQKGMVFLRKRDLAKAAESFRWAADLDPKNGDYQAWKTWVKHLRDGGEDSPEKTAAVRDELVALIKRFPQSFYVARFLAKVHHKLGEKEKYFKALSVAHRLNPKDVEVARELRLFKMRKEKEEKKGLFGRLKR